MGAIGTHPLSAFAAGRACLIGGKFVCRSPCMGGFSTFPSDLALALAIHRRETAIVGS
jgi:hypothetical protein